MKRLLAALLTLSMLVGIVPFSAFAESPGAVPETFAAAQESPGLDDETVQSIVSDPLLQGQYAPPQQAQPTVDTSNMSMEATDSFGKLLVNSIDEQNSASSSENRVIGVTVDGSTATVEYVAAEDADIVVALYTDDSEELMSASGTVDVFAMEENTGHSTVTVPLTGSIPASFIVKAFLLDKDDHAPLCNEFTSLAYTKDLSDLESSTIYDYPENQVVNLDEDASNNFAVVTSDVTLITSDENIGTQNQITELDNDNLYYTIENASEEIQALQPGDILTYEYEPGYFLIARILDISVNGSTVRIHGDETLDIDDVFDVIKIGTTATTEDFTVNESALPSNIEYGGLVPVDDNETDGISTRASGSVRVGHIDSGNTALEQAYEGNPISSCGDNATWSIDNAGTLTIRGTGEITDTPWSDPMILPYSVHIKNVVLEDGITGICSYAFDYTDIVSVTLPATLTHIDYSAFDGCSDLTTVNYAGSPEQWNNIKIANHNDELLNATKHYYSSNASTVSSEENSIFPSTATGNDHSFAASFSDLTPGVSYAVIVSRSEIDLLAPENLIYINQFRATSSGYQQSFQTPRSSALNADDMTYVIASGIYSFDEAPTPTPTPGGGSSSGGGGGGGGGAAVLIGVGAAAAITAGVIMMSPVDVKGRVVLADQAAVPGAKISLLREGKVVAQTTADENGSFALKAKRGSYELTAAYTTADGQLIYKTIDIKAPAKDLTVTF